MVSRCLGNNEAWRKFDSSIVLSAKGHSKLAYTIAVLHNKDNSKDLAMHTCAEDKDFVFEAARGVANCRGTKPYSMSKLLYKVPTFLGISNNRVLVILEGWDRCSTQAKAR